MQRVSKSNKQVIDYINQQFRLIGPGVVYLRDDRINKQWQKTIDGYYLSSKLVEQKIYQQVMGVNPSLFKNPNAPVECVSWFDAIHFCNRLSVLADLKPCYEVSGSKVGFDKKANGYFLPTEAQWQFACQNANINILTQSWFRENSQCITHPVAMLNPDDLGLYDMLGNVWEWCWDLYHEQDYGEYRIFRGGGFDDMPRSLLPTNRRRSHPTFNIEDLGFRIAKNNLSANIMGNVSLRANHSIKC